MRDEPLLLDTTEFDAIVIGTGLTESIVAGALARAGQSVLHLDHRGYYGGNRATIDLGTLLELANSNEPTGSFVEWDIRSAADAETLDTWKRQARQFSIDLAPAVLFSRGPLVNSLSTSGVSRYNEFKVVESTSVRLHGANRKVPCSKNEIFADKQLSLVDKRCLMRFLGLCMDHQENLGALEEESGGTSFVEFLGSHKLNQELQAVICYALACTGENQLSQPVDVQAGLEAVARYLGSVGRFNSTAFLCVNYGIGELPQAFCRLCAVYKGTYILGRGIRELSLEPSTGRCTGVVCEVGQSLRARKVVCNAEYLPQYHQDSAVRQSRAICIHNKAWIDQGGVALSTSPPQSPNTHPVFMLQSDSSNGTCPDELYVLYLVTTAVHDSAAQDLEEIVAEITGEEPLWVVYYTQHTPRLGALPEGVHACPAPPGTLLAEQALVEAQTIFESICPDGEFLPPAPEQDDDCEDL